MKNKDFKDLLTSIDQARKIHAGKMKPGRKRLKESVSVFLKAVETNPKATRFICKAKCK